MTKGTIIASRSQPSDAETSRPPHESCRDTTACVPAPDRSEFGS